MFAEDVTRRGEYIDGKTARAGMLQGPLPDCAQCQELVKAADEAHRLAKQALLSKVQAIGGTWALTNATVDDADPTLEPVRLALRTLLSHVHQHVKA